MAPQISTTPQTGTTFTGDAGSDFDLNIETVSALPVVGALLNDTGDGCTSTCASACSNSTCG
ncbi:FxLD family lanthipeptide [Streptomyces sp. NBC_01716]|uniref:FxLD family lanthipeptide n=1 Tax=Streptomyces sp. NBC_01716 TaxID=2975917 RepID=UPI002E2F8644|nr:FxLD family lanthipeptide [Streptomyces sp. NBC_01716]